MQMINILLLFLLFLFAYSFQIYIALFQCLSILIQTCLIFCLVMSCCMQMPVATHRGIVTWSPAGIYMQYARYGKKSFKFDAPSLWNSLQDHFRTEHSFSQFKSLLQSWNGPKCPVLHVDDYNFASGLLLFFFIFYLFNI